MPFRIGSGTRLKLIESMAAAKPLVSTTVGAEGFPVTDRENIYLADTAVAMSQAILHLLAQPGERQRVGQQARTFARNYDWRRVIPAFEAVYNKAQRQKRSSLS